MMRIGLQWGNLTAPCLTEGIAMRQPLQHMKIRPFQFGVYDPLSNTYGKVRAHHNRAHQGWDLLATPGTPVYAIANGELRVGYSTSYGNWLLLKFSHNGHDRYAFYAHLQSILIKDCSVAEGMRIATTGRSGNASGIPAAEAHLHFEVRTKNPVARGLLDRIDPGDILGYAAYNCTL